MKRALVLGGGGLVGVAWESGLAAGLFEGGIDLRNVDAIVGTSAGAIIGSQLAAGRWPDGPDAPRPAGATGANVDSSRINVEALGAAFNRWSKMERTTREDAAGIGSIARTLYRDMEDGWVQGISLIAGVNGPQWPSMPLLITAVDTATGERMIFDAKHGVALGRAIAASAAVPGIFPSVAIGDALYMDGQVHSSTHADVLVPMRPSQVIIVMPTNKYTAPGIGKHAAREAEDEVAKLRAAGSEVFFVSPRAEHVERLGRNLMDPSRVPQAHAVGVEMGRELATQLS